MEEEDRYTRITLRIPKDLHEILTAAADRTSKSLNAEIIGRLQASVPDDSEARALAVLPERSSIRDDLMDSITELTALRTEKAVYELRLDMAAATRKPIAGLQELTARLRFVNLEIERLQAHVERFKAEAIEAYGRASSEDKSVEAKAHKPSGSGARKPKKP